VNEGLRTALLSVEPSLVIVDNPDGSARVSLPGGPGMRIRPEFYPQITGNPTALLSYAGSIVEKLQKESR